MSDTLAYRPLFGARLNMSHPLAQNMYGCWLLNDRGNRALDLSPYGAHGALTGFGSPAKRAFNGLQFTAATPSYVEIPASYTQLNFTSGDFSFIVRVYIDSVAATPRLLNRGESNTDGWEYSVSAGGALFLGLNQAAVHKLTYTADGTVTTGAFHTLGVSRGLAVTMFIDGLPMAVTSEGNSDPVSSFRTLKIGLNDDRTSRPLDGKIEFLYIFGKKALAAFEQKAIHESPYAPFGTPLFI